MSNRPSIFDDPLDLSGFTPKPAAPTAPAPQQLDQLSQGSKFRSREAPPEAAPPASTAPKRAPRLHRTGRNATLSVKTTPAAIELFYQLADRAELKVGETFERALAALQRELDQQGR